MSEPEDGGGGEADGRKVGVRVAVVAGGGAAPVLDTTKGVFDAVPLAIEDLVVLDHDLAGLALRDAGSDAL